MPPLAEVERRIQGFQYDLLNFSDLEMVQKHVTYGDCYALSQSSYFRLKAKVAQEFGIHHSEVLLVGSGKLGFSIVDSKRYRPFGDTSDLDIAIISTPLFDEMWIDVFEYWRFGGYWPELDQFRKYLFRGWLRPDKLPPEQSFIRRRHWWEFFRELTNSQDFGPYQIRAGLYKSWHFLESYQGTCINECRNLLGS